MRYSTIPGAVLVALLAAAGCSSPPTVDADVQAGHRSMPAYRQSPQEPGQSSTASSQNTDSRRQTSERRQSRA